MTVLKEHYNTVSNALRLFGAEPWELKFPRTSAFLLDIPNYGNNVQCYLHRTLR